MLSRLELSSWISNDLKKKVDNILPGFLLCCVVAMSAKFVTEHYGGATILYALLMGMSLNYLSHEGKCMAGIQFTAQTVLRVGIALLGARITFEQLLSLGFTPIAIVVVGIPATILFSYACGKWLKLESGQIILSGSSVGICGASAALAVVCRFATKQRVRKASDFHHYRRHSTQYHCHDCLPAVGSGARFK